MRASSVLLAALAALFVGCGARADDPKVTAPILPQDVQKICALVRAETTEPIAEISEVTTDAPIAGVSPRKTVNIATNGERQETAMYPCPDRVWVFTHPAQGAPLWFDVQKKDEKWAIVKTERVTYR
jgi:hypothetical protein